MGDDEPCNIVGKGDVIVSLSNGSTLKLKDVSHVSKQKRNLISVGQLADAGMKTIFDGDLCKITKGAMIIVHDKKRYPLHDFRLYDFSFSCIIRCECLYLASPTCAYEREGDEDHAHQRQAIRVEVY